MFCPPEVVPAPNDSHALTDWIQTRISEPCPHWRPKSAAARALPVPINLPGMDKAAGAVLVKYRSMPIEWCSDVIQDFMVLWLLRPETPATIARSAIAGKGRGLTPTIERAIAWKLRMEILSRANRAYKRVKREEEIFVELERATSLKGERK